MSLSFLLTSLIVVISPGTGVLYTLATALTRGSRASVAAAFGCTLGILPAMDAVHYYTMLLIDRALKAGKPIDAARKSADHHCEHPYYDFAFGQFRFHGLDQHFWQPFEVRYRFARAAFTLKRLKKIHLSWKQFAGGKELQEYAPPWDWFFLATKEPQTQ